MSVLGHAPAWMRPFPSALDGETWHLAECRRLWQQHGPAAFAGLELWGVPDEPSEAAAGERGPWR